MVIIPICFHFYKLIKLQKSCRNRTNAHLLLPFLILFYPQIALVSALSALCGEYYQAEPGQTDTQMQGEFISLLLCLKLDVFSPYYDDTHVFVSACVDVLVSQYTEGLKSPQMLTRCGSALALGCLPRFMIHRKLKQVCWEALPVFRHCVSNSLCIYNVFCLCVCV